MNKVRISTEIENVRKCQTNHRAEEYNNSTKNFCEGFNSRQDQAEKGISELEDRALEFIQSEQKKEKRMKRIEDNLRHLWDNIKCTNIRI